MNESANMAYCLKNNKIFVNIPGTASNRILNIGDYRYRINMTVTAKQLLTKNKKR